VLGVICAFRGVVAAGNPWNVTSGGFETTADNSISVPGATTSVPDCLVVIAVALEKIASFSAWANADLANVLERVDAATSAGNDGSLGIATGEKATTGTYGSTTATTSVSVKKGYMTIALAPEEPRRGQVSFVEVQVDTAPRRAELSHAAFETPSAPRRAETSFVEIETPEGARIAQASFAELETPNAARRAELSWTEMSVAVQPARRGQVSVTSFEVPVGARRAQLSQTELETPFAARIAKVSWTELQVPIGARRGEISFTQFQIPPGARRSEISFVELQTGAAGVIPVVTSIVRIKPYKIESVELLDQFDVATIDGASPLILPAPHPLPGTNVGIGRVFTRVQVFTNPGLVGFSIELVRNSDNATIGLAFSDLQNDTHATEYDLLHFPNYFWLTPDDGMNVRLVSSSGHFPRNFTTGCHLKYFWIRLNADGEPL